MNLDTEQLNALAPEQRERYMELERLFASKGWRVVIKTAQTNMEAAHNAAANASSWADNRMAIGNRAAWQQIVNMEEQTEAIYESVAARAQEQIALLAISDEHENE